MMRFFLRRRLCYLLGHEWVSGPWVSGIDGERYTCVYCKYCLKIKE